MPGSSPSNPKRRFFLRTLGSTGAAAVGVMALPGALSQRLVPNAHGTEVVRRYPTVYVADIGALAEGEPISFEYPDEQHSCLLMKLGSPAMDGVGPDTDIVAFSTICPHMGCSIAGNYHSDRPDILGPCPCHFSCFDLSRQGFQIQGQATESLPQVMLEVVGETIHAIGIRGLLYGRHDNLIG